MLHLKQSIFFQSKLLRLIYHKLLLVRQALSSYNLVGGFWRSYNLTKAEAKRRPFFMRRTKLGELGSLKVRRLPAQ